MATTVEGEDKVLATAQRIVQSLTNASDADDMFMIFSAFDNRLSALSSFVDHGNSNSHSISGASFNNDSASASLPKLLVNCASPETIPSPLDARFDAAEEIILNESDSISDEYYSAVDDIINLMEELDLNKLPDDAAERVHNAIQLAMTCLEEEFRHILVRSTVPLDQDRLHRSSLSSSAAAIAIAATEFLNNEEGSESIEDVSSGRYSSSGDTHNRGVSFGGDELAIELIRPEAVDELKGIADRMIRTGYEKECCQVYCNVRRDVLDECVAILDVEKLSIEDVQRIGWKSLDDKMRKWVYAMKIVVRGLLSSEKHLCEQIFTESELIKEVCFLETSKGCVMQLLNFGEAVAIGRRSAEKLFRILDMYDALAQVLPDLQDLFMDEDAGDMVCNEAKGVLNGLGEAAIGTFVEFENAVKGESSKKPIQNGEIHPLTRYVMNYLTLLVDYCGTLNSLLEDEEIGSDEAETVTNDTAQAESMSPFARRLLALITSLESNLEEKSKIYEDIAMQYIFRMNSILYIVNKVKGSELRKLLGDNWVRKRRGLVRQYATHYLRNSWTCALDYLKDKGIGGSSNNASKMVLKDRFKNFNACFEEIYRVQTAWKVPDPQLREELRISISEKVIPAYRSFLGRFGSQLENGRHSGKYIKYTPEDLEYYLLNLFEGTPLILHHLRKKST